MSVKKEEIKQTILRMRTMNLCICCITTTMLLFWLLPFWATCSNIDALFEAASAESIRDDGSDTVMGTDKSTIQFQRGLKGGGGGGGGGGFSGGGAYTSSYSYLSSSRSGSSSNGEDDSSGDAIAGLSISFTFLVFFGVVFVAASSHRQKIFDTDVETSRQAVQRACADVVTDAIGMGGTTNDICDNLYENDASSDDDTRPILLVPARRVDDDCQIQNNGRSTVSQNYHGFTDDTNTELLAASTTLVPAILGSKTSEVEVEHRRDGTPIAEAIPIMSSSSTATPSQCPNIASRNSTSSSADYSVLAAAPLPHQQTCLAMTLPYPYYGAVAHYGWYQPTSPTNGFYMGKYYESGTFCLTRTHLLFSPRPSSVGWGISGTGTDSYGSFYIMEGRVAPNGLAYWIEKQRGSGGSVRLVLNTGRFVFANCTFQGRWHADNGTRCSSYRMSLTL